MILKPKMQPPFVLLTVLAGGALGWLTPQLCAGEPADNVPPSAPGIRFDLYGDPLPEHALARLGTVRLRHASSVDNGFFFADGKTVISGGRDASIVFWDIATGKAVRRLSGPSSFNRMAVSPDGMLLAAADESGGSAIWNLADGRQLRHFDGERSRVLVHAFSQDGKRLLTATADGNVRVWEVGTGKSLYQLHVPMGEFGDLTFSPGGKLVAYGDGEGKISIREITTGKELRHWSGAGFIEVMRFTPDARHLITGGMSNVVSAWKVATGEIVRQFYTTQEHIWSLAFSPDGTTLATAEGSGTWTAHATICLWDFASGKKVRELREHRGPVGCLAFSRDGKRLVSGSADCTVRVWDTATGKQLVPIEGHQGIVESVAVSSDNRIAATACRDRRLRLWDLSTGRQLHELAADKERLTSVAFSPDGKLLASAGLDSIIRIWDTARAVVIRECRGHERAAETVAFSPDGNMLASGGIDRTIRLWDVQTGKEQRRLDGYLEVVDQVIFSPDGRLLASAGDRSNTIHLWDTDSGRERSALTVAMNARAIPPITPKFNVYVPGRVAFSPDGKMLAVSRRENVVRLYEVANGNERFHFEGPETWISSIAFSPDGRVLAAGSGAVLWLWDTTSGKQLGKLEGHRGLIDSLAFTPDGNKLVSCGADTTGLVWDVAPFKQAGGAAHASPEQLNRMWAELEGEDAAKAYRAIVALEASSQQAVFLLEKNLHPPAAVHEKHLNELIRSLADPRFETREKATRELQVLAEQARPALMKAVKSPSSEVRRRAEQLLDRIQLSVGDQLIVLRAIEVLEHIGTAEARRLLKKIGEETSVNELRLQAKASLERLGRRGR